MYNRILGQIEKEDVPYAIRILRWLAFASRPLYLREVAEVATLDSDRKPAFDRDEVLQDPSEVLTICSSLVTVVHIYNTGDFGEQYQSDDHSNIDSSIELEVNSGYMVLLAHYSVKEYLVSKRILESKANLYGIDSTLCHQILAKSCLLYLFQLNMSDLPRYSVLRDSELVTYSAEAWIYHYKLIQTPDPELNELVVELFRAKGTFPNMIAFSNMTRLSTGKTVMWWQHAGKLPKSVFIACELGLLHVVQRLVSETSVDINEPTNNAMTLLEIAARSGYLSLVELLLERGALTKDDALVSACIEGHLEVVRLLVEQGAQVNAQDKRRFSSLYWASASGHLSIVQYLIERGADIKTPDETALYIASSHGHLDIVRVLVENGADINALDGRHPGALCGASYGGHVEIVEYLVKNGADVNAKSREGENALALASAKGNFDVVQYLIENGAEADTQEDDRYGNPLEEAARRLRLNILEHWGGSEEVGGDIIDGPRR
jgi:ankyrin repeat protein